MLLTRLELFLRQSNLRPVELAREAGYTRQHFRRLRMGESDATRGGILSLVEAARRMSGKHVTADVLFERGDAFLNGSGQRSSLMHAEDRRALDSILAQEVTAQFADRLRASGVASETAVLHLLNGAHARLGANPEAAAAIYDAAADMGATLRDSPRELVQSLLGHAYKGRANALRKLARFQEALLCLERAGRRFGDAYFTDEVGQVGYTRATILAEMELWDDALAATRIALSHFTRTGNHRHAAKAEMLEAIIFFEQGNMDMAHAKWVRLTKVLAALRDHQDLASVWVNLGICEIARDRPADARRWLTQASAAFRKLDNTAELARTRWNMGTYVATFESPRRALRVFRNVYRTFRSLKMWLDAGSVGLDMAEIMIDLAMPDDELAIHACDVADTFARAEIGDQLAPALEQFRKITHHDDRHRIVRTVRANALSDAP